MAAAVFAAGGHAMNKRAAREEGIRRTQQMLDDEAKIVPTPPLVLCEFARKGCFLIDFLLCACDGFWWPG